MAEKIENNNTEQSENKKIGVFLSLKTRLKSTNEIFDYSSKDNEILVTFIDKRTYICMKENSEIKTEYTNQNEILLIINREGNSFYINNMTYKNHKIDLENLRKINKYIWYVINSDSNSIINPNDDYDLKEGDIIKFGKIKLFVKKIVIIDKTEKENNKEKRIIRKKRIMRKKRIIRKKRILRINI